MKGVHFIDAASPGAEIQLTSLGRPREKANQKVGGNHRLIKYSLDNLRPIRTAEAFEAVDWLHQQTWLHCGIA